MYHGTRFCCRSSNQRSSHSNLVYSDCHSSLATLLAKNVFEIGGVTFKCNVCEQGVLVSSLLVHAACSSALVRLDLFLSHSRGSLPQRRCKNSSGSNFFGDSVHHPRQHDCDCWCEPEKWQPTTQTSRQPCCANASGHRSLRTRRTASASATSEPARLRGTCATTVIARVDNEIEDRSSQFYLLCTV